MSGFFSKILGSQENRMIFKVLGVKNNQQQPTKKIVLSKTVLQNKGDKDFTKQKLREFIITKPALQKILKGILQA